MDVIRAVLIASRVLLLDVDLVDPVDRARLRANPVDRVDPVGQCVTRAVLPYVIPADVYPRVTVDRVEPLRPTVCLAMILARLVCRHLAVICALPILRVARASEPQFPLSITF